MDQENKRKQKVFWYIVTSVIILIVSFAIYSDYRSNKLTKGR